MQMSDGEQFDQCTNTVSVNYLFHVALITHNNIYTSVHTPLANILNSIQLNFILKTNTQTAVSITNRASK